MKSWKSKWLSTYLTSTTEAPSIPKVPLSHPELKEAIASLGIEAKAAVVYQMIAELDSDGSGQIEFDEFYEMMTHKPNEQ